MSNTMTKPQRAFIDATEPYVLISGPRACGKTYALLKWVREVKSDGGRVIVIMERPLFGALAPNVRTKDMHVDSSFKAQMLKGVSRLGVDNAHAMKVGLLDAIVEACGLNCKVRMTAYPSTEREHRDAVEWLRRRFIEKPKPGWRMVDASSPFMDGGVRLIRLA